MVWLTDFLQQAFEGLIKAAALGLTTLVGAWVLKLTQGAAEKAKTAKLANDEQINKNAELIRKKLLEVAGVGIARAEELAIQKSHELAAHVTKTVEGAVVMSGEEKQKEAIKLASELDADFRKLSSEVQAGIVDAKLNQLRRASFLPPVGSSLRPPGIDLSNPTIPKNPVPSVGVGPTTNRVVKPK